MPLKQFKPPPDSWRKACVDGRPRTGGQGPAQTDGGRLRIRTADPLGVNEML